MKWAEYMIKQPCARRVHCQRHANSISARMPALYLRQMTSLLPIVRPFAEPYDAWSYRMATHEEMMASVHAGNLSLWVNDKLLARVTSEHEAAGHMASRGVDNGLEGHIDRRLAADAGFQQWLRAMPVTTPHALQTYQHEFPPDDFSQADQAIRMHGATLSPGQLLFHGGHLRFPPDGMLVTQRPLSTTFCPQVALRSAEWRGKAYVAGQVDLNLLRVNSSETKAFIFDPNGSEKGHEKEVLFASGTTLILRSRQALRSDYTVCRATNHLRTEEKVVTVYLCEVDLL